MIYVCYNGNSFDNSLPHLFARNRGFKYGDGVFETARMSDGKLLLKELHFDRLLSSLKLLQIKFDESFEEQLLISINELAQKNNCALAARIRVTVFREDENKAGFLIEATSLTSQFYRWNKRGWEIDIHPVVQKSCDVFANLKSASYLPYVMADLYAKEKRLDECLVGNNKGFIADGSKTNIFLIKDESLYTPALHHGCVAGVMRRFVISEAAKKGYDVKEKEINIDVLQSADEVFLTNAIQGIQWVKKFRNKMYQYGITKQIFDSVLD